MVDQARRQATRVTRGLLRRARTGAARAARTAEIARLSAIGGRSELPQVAGRAARLVGRRGFTLDEAFTLGLLDPARTDEDVALSVSKREMIREQARLNPNEFWYWTEDKAVFYRHAETIGLPVPRLYAILCESGPGWSCTGDVIAGSGDWERLFAEGLPDTFVVKPARGYYGLDVRVIERHGDRLIELGGGEIAPAELRRQLVANRQFHIHVVQERLVNHPDVPGGRDALQTIRISTLVERDGTVRVINAFFKMALDGAPIDNFRFGATGNLLSAVDVRNGTFINLIAAGPGGVLREVDPPPGTNAPVPGARMPMWDECCAAVCAASPAFLPMRTLGWDVAVTPDGVRIVEANMWWDPVGSQRGVHDALLALRQA